MTRSRSRCGRCSGAEQICLREVVALNRTNSRVFFKRIGENPALCADQVRHGSRSSMSMPSARASLAMASNEPGFLPVSIWLR